MTVIKTAHPTIVATNISHANEYRICTCVLDTQYATRYIYKNNGKTNAPFANEKSPYLFEHFVSHECVMMTRARGCVFTGMASWVIKRTFRLVFNSVQHITNTFLWTEPNRMFIFLYHTRQFPSIFLFFLHRIVLLSKIPFCRFNFSPDWYVCMEQRRKNFICIFILFSILCCT